MRVRLALAVLLAAAAAVYARALTSGANYDEGVYLASLRELEHGASIGGSLFTSQPPGFYYLLRVLGLAGGSLHSLRAFMLALAVAACVAAFALGRQLAGDAAGLGCAAALAIAPPWPVESTRLEADAPGAALTLVALALAPRFPLAAGVAFGVAVSVKLFAVAVLVPLALLTRSRLRTAAGAAAAALVLALPVLRHLGGVWHDAVAFHLHARSVDAPSLGSNVHRILTFTDLHTPFGWLVAAAIVVAVVGAVRRRAQPWWPLWTFPLSAAVVLAVQHPLLDHHMVLLAAAWALPTGVTLGAAAGRRPAFAVAAVLVVAAGLAQQWRHLAPTPAGAEENAAVALVARTTRAHAVVASDLPIVPFRAGRRQPPDLVDTSAVRVESGDLSRADVLRDLDGATAVVLGRTLAADPQLVHAVAARYPRRLRAGSITVYLRPR